MFFKTGGLKLIMFSKHSKNSASVACLNTFKSTHEKDTSGQKRSTDRDQEAKKKPIMNDLVI